MFVLQSFYIIIKSGTLFLSPDLKYKEPPLWDNHLPKPTNAESTQANSHTIVTV